MAKTRGVDAKLSRLRALRLEAAAPGHLAELRGALADASNLVAADAADIVGMRMLPELAPDLVAAFERFMIEPAETDKLCRAKTAMVETLNKIEYDQEGVFLRGIRHVQMEPRWGGEQDTAGALRGSSAFGLVRINYHDVVMLLADLLTDSDRNARLAAAQALGVTRAPAALPLLRFKARTGDQDAAITAECLSALMVAAPKESLSFVTEFLHSHDDAIQEGAAFALAESRRPEVFDLLKSHWLQARHSSFQAALSLALSMTRLPAALDFLLDVLVGESEPAAFAALSALAIHRHNESIKERVAVIVAKGSAALQERFKKKFADH